MFCRFLQTIISLTEDVGVAARLQFRFQVSGKFSEDLHFSSSMWHNLLRFSTMNQTLWMLIRDFIDVSVVTYSQNCTQAFVHWRRVSTSWSFQKCEAAKVMGIISCSCLHSCCWASAWVLSRRSIHVNTDTNWPKSQQNHTTTAGEVYPELSRTRRKSLHF